MQRKLETFVRSQYFNSEIIKVVYLGKKHGFHYGKVIEAKARMSAGTNKPFPFPKNLHVCFEIVDEDGDNFEVSHDGNSFSPGWFPVPLCTKLGLLAEKER